MPAKTRQQIALDYGICTKTLNKWLKNAHINLPAGSISPYNQKLINQSLGSPKFKAR
jgi:abortive infection bacteriophage resistance protein